MTVSQALSLIREKYQAEQKGKTEAALAAKYAKACEDFPVTMHTALTAWANKFVSGTP